MPVCLHVCNMPSMQWCSTWGRGHMEEGPSPALRVITVLAKDREADD